MSAWLKKRLQDLATFMARSLNRFLDWLFESQNPAVVFVRETIRRNRVLMFAARAFIRTVRGLPTLKMHIRERFTPSSVRRLQSVMAARMTGGSLSVSELERVWDLAKRRAVLVIAEGPELAQLEIVFKAIGARVTVCNGPAACEAAGRDIDGFSLIVVAPVHGLTQAIVELQSAVRRPDRFVRVGEGAKRSDYFVPASALLPAGEAPEGVRLSIQEKLARGLPLRVVFLNDVGFQYGAGVALRRQVASLLLKGWEVAVVAWTPGNMLDPPKVTGVTAFAGWRGVHDVFAIHSKKGLGADQVASELTSKVRELDPDVVITGNLHGTAQPFTLLRELRSSGIHVVAFMHDTYFVTGRCAQPLTCNLYRTGCDERCPTPGEYPSLASEKIAAAWRERGELFAGGDPLPLIGNSRWTQNIVLQRFGSAAKSGFVHLALDHELFAPIPKSIARRLLGISDDRPIVVLGAVDVNDQWKGGPLFHGLHKALLARSDVALVLFGHSSEKLASMKSFGLVTDQRMMPLILNAADIFVSTATAESFGQSLLEASACAVPVVSFDVGGVGDVVVDNETGILVREPSVEDLLQAIDRLVADRVGREKLGRAGRVRVTNNFTLKHQADAWVDCLKRIC
jgi:glycosyltransferase involved in cell wall biosynthesis